MHIRRKSVTVRKEKIDNAPSRGDYTADKLDNSVCAAEFL